MRTVPLYTDTGTAHVFTAEPLANNPRCERCTLACSAHHRCLPADGEPGGLLVLGESPSRVDDQTGRPFGGTLGKWARATIKKHWQGPVIFDNAVRCFVGDVALAPLRKALDTCRGYLRAVLEEAKPTRILTFGRASHALLGEVLDGNEIKRPWGLLYGAPWDPYGVPVFGVEDYNVAYNKHSRTWIEEDIRNALTMEVPTPITGGGITIIESEEESLEACAQIRAQGACVVDVETSGQMYSASFNVEAVGIALVGADTEHAWVWLNWDVLSPALKALMLDPKVTKVAHNAKFDAQAVTLGMTLPSPAQGFTEDTMLMWRLHRSDASGGLALLAQLVGCGGHKGEMEGAKEAAHKRVQDVLKAEAKVAKAKAEGKAPPILVIPTLTEVELPERLHKMARDPEVERDAWVYGIADQSVITRYVARDAITTSRLYTHLRNELRDTPMEDTYERLVRRAQVACTHVERWGLSIDSTRVYALDALFGLRERNALDRLERLHPGVDWNSPKQIAKVLFTDLGLRGSNKRTPTGGMSTDAETLEAVAKANPKCETPNVLLEYREWSKLRSMYALPMLAYKRDDQRVHPSIMLGGAASGRTSCIARGQRVLTKRGYIEIQDILLGDQVWTHKARWRSVTRVLHQGRKPVFDVRLCNGQVLRCTEDHRVLTCLGWASIRGANALMCKLQGWRVDPEIFGHFEVQEYSPSRVEEVFDLTVDEDESFTVGEVFVHNCRDPNLQQLRRPSKDDPQSPGKLVRDVFVAPEGSTLVQFDYKQLEVVVAAIISGDEVMGDIFRAGVDFHTRTAQLISKAAWGIEPSQVTKEHRSQAKAVSFGVLYGKTDAALARDLKLSIEAAAGVRAALFGQFKSLAAWCKRTVEETRRTGCCYTVWDGKPARRRFMPGIVSEDPRQRGHYENGAINTPIQGTGSDYCIASLTACVEWILEERIPAKLIMPVHDSLLFEVQDEAVDEVIAVVPQIMCGWPSGGIPLAVDCEVGKAWGSLETWKG